MANPKKQIESKSHFILQGKGGVGKSVISTFLLQYLREKYGEIVKGFDTDPTNQSFLAFKGLGVELIEIVEGKNRVSERKFDDLIEALLEAEIAVVDNGSTGFLPVCNYIIQNEVIDFLIESRKKVLIHIPITGGQTFIDTAEGLVSICEQFPETAEVILWINEFFGPLEKKLEEYKFYKRVQDRINNIVTIHEQDPDTFSTDITIMLTQRKTFEELTNDPAVNKMVKRRLRIYKESLFKQLTEIGL